VTGREVMTVLAAEIVTGREATTVNDSSRESVEIVKEREAMIDDRNPTARERREWWVSFYFP
jgi:hypothetical protein